MADTVYFGSSLGPPIILGAAVFSIAWGVVNALLIKRINMDDAEPIRQALNDAGIEVVD